MAGLITTRSIFGEVGGSFVLGSVGCALLGLFKQEHLVRRRIAATGGSFAVWNGACWVADKLLISIRGKNDLLTPLISGSLAGVFLSIRSCKKQIIRNLISGGLVTFMIELGYLGIYKYIEKRNRKRA